MEKFYSILIATNELRRSPTISMYGRLHDVVIDLGVEQIVTFLLPIYVQTRKQEDICVLFNPDLIEVIDATVQSESTAVRVLTHVSVRLIGRDIGSTSIGFATPATASDKISGLQPAFAYHMATMPTPHTA